MALLMKSALSRSALPFYLSVKVPLKSQYFQCQIAVVAPPPPPCACDKEFEEDGKSNYDINPQFKSGGLDSECIIHQLQKWLNCSQHEGELVLRQVPVLKHQHLESVDELISWLKREGMTNEMLISDPRILCHSVSTLRPKLELISKVGLSSDTAPLLKLTTRQLREVINQWLVDEKNNECGTFRNRLDYLGYHLQSTASQIASLIVKKPTLMTVRFSKIADTMNLLFRYDIEPEDIRRNLSVFSASTDQLKDRLEKARLARICNIKVWLLLSPERTFQNNVHKWNDTKYELENTDVYRYLAERLECSPDYVRQCLVKRHQSLASTRLVKLKSILDFLFQNQFTPDQVCLAPYVFRANLDTLKSRLREYERLGYRPVHLHSLCATTAEHKRFLKQLTNG